MRHILATVYCTRRLAFKDRHREKNCIYCSNTYLIHKQTELIVALFQKKKTECDMNTNIRFGEEQYPYNHL